MTLTDLFLESFKNYKDKIAYEYSLKTESTLEWENFTYGDVRNYSIKIWSFIKNYVSEEKKVILYAENSPWWCISYIGIILSGAIAVPVDIEIDKETLKTIIDDSEAKLILYSEKTSDKIGIYQGFNIEKIRDLPFPDKINFSQNQDDSPASIIYTSGTTGKPKGVILTHRNFIFQIEAIKKTGIIASDENILSILPLHHTYPFVCSFLVPFSFGAKVTFLQQIKGVDLLNIIKTKKITAMVVVPKILELLEKQIVERIKNLPFPISLSFLGIKKLSYSLREKFNLTFGKYLFFFIHLKTGFQFKFFASGGARLDPDVMKNLEAFGFTIIEGYGLTETSPVVSFNPKNKRKPGSVGKPLESVEVKIVRPDENGIGEIAVKGPLIMKGYYRNEELTKESIKNEWFFTGDMGYIDEEGYLFITGRKKDVIILPSGKTVYPEDVEKNYKKKIPLIKEICLLDTMEAIIVPDVVYAKQKGIINIKSNLIWQLDAVSKELPSYMRIKGFHLYSEDLPKTRLGKFKRFLIKDIVHQKIKDKEQKVPSEPLDEIGKAIEKIIKSIFPSIKAIQKSDHLELDISMDSIDRIEFVLAVEKEFSVKLTDDIVNKWSTIEDVIEDIKRLKDTTVTEKISYKTARGRLFKTANLTILAFGHLLLRLFFKIFYQLRVYGLENLPSQPFIIIPNHTSYFDGFVIFASLPFKKARYLYFQGHRKYFPNDFIAELINVFPLSPDKDYISAIEKSKEILKEGCSLCIFPEGGRSFDGEIRELKTGFATLSIETGVSVVPTIIKGTFEALPRGKMVPKLHKIIVVFDRLIIPPSNLQEAENFKEEVREKLIALQKSEY
jgi:long-chain acyl-CoA synthetase